MYAGLTIADKTALEDAKARGAEWVARDENERLMIYQEKPFKDTDLLNMWLLCSPSFAIEVEYDALYFIQWYDAEPVNIDLALSQIAEMERAQKPCPYCSTDAFSPRRIGLYGAEGFNPYHVYLNSGGNVREGEQFDYCPKCGKRINMEGENP